MLFEALIFCSMTKHLTLHAGLSLSGAEYHALGVRKLAGHQVAFSGRKRRSLCLRGRRLRLSRLSMRLHVRHRCVRRSDGGREVFTDLSGDLWSKPIDRDTRWSKCNERALSGGFSMPVLLRSGCCEIQGFVGLMDFSLERESPYSYSHMYPHNSLHPNFVLPSSSIKRI